MPKRKLEQTYSNGTYSPPELTFPAQLVEEPIPFPPRKNVRLENAAGQEHVQQPLKIKQTGPPPSSLTSDSLRAKDSKEKDDGNKSYTSGPASRERQKCDRDESELNNNPSQRLRNGFGEASEEVLAQKPVKEGNREFKASSVKDDLSISPEHEETAASTRGEARAKTNPIRYWAANQTWPVDFGESREMATSNKRPRASGPSEENENSRQQSYAECRKAGEVPEPYSAAYEKLIFTKGLDMDIIKGEILVSEESKTTCVRLQKINYETVGPTIFPDKLLRAVINDCGSRNEATVFRNVTQMILPPVRAFYYQGDGDFEFICDEATTIWYSQCVLEGPRLKPDLAIGLLSSAFTEKELKKLNYYKSVDNWTQFTNDMYFPILMCEVKCGRGGLDMADRHNMHSCSVAVRAILRIEQEADKYRDEKEFASLSGQTLVFSISHDQKDVRIYGHYAITGHDKWQYYRYAIESLNIFLKRDALLAVHNFARNVIKDHAKNHLKRLKETIAVLPDPPELSSSGYNLTLDEPQEVEVIGEGSFKKPEQPSVLLRQLEIMTQQLELQRKESAERMEKQLELQRKESAERMEKQMVLLRKESAERMEKQMELLRKESAERMEKQRENLEQQRRETD